MKRHSWKGRKKKKEILWYQKGLPSCDSEVGFEAIKLTEVLGLIQTWESGTLKYLRDPEL